MSVLCARNVLPVVTSVLATLFLATAVPHDLSSAAAAPAVVAQVALQRCVAVGRDADACLDEADGIALIERADSLARASAPTPEASR